MVVGNPSTNAPWRAYTWMRAFLAEFNLEPWGTIKDAVQASLELAEPVDIKQLPVEYQDEITWQELLNWWANQNVCQYGVRCPPQQKNRHRWSGHQAQTITHSLHISQRIQPRHRTLL